MKTKIILLIAFFCSTNALIAQQFLNETILHDGLMREYRVYVPNSYDGTSPVPLLFNFHGGAGDIASQIFTSDMRPIADTANFILVYPQALVDINNGGSTSWTHKEPTDVDDIFFVEAMIDALAANYAIDESRVYACGYSNGGEFTFELACRLSNRIAAIGVVARSMYIDTYDNCAPTHPTAVVTIHGSLDEYEGITWLGTTYYVALADVNTYWGTHNNTNTTPTVQTLPNWSSNDGSTVEHYSWSEGDACVSVEHFKVIGGGHDWPGTFGNMDMDASEEIWKFVSQYDYNGLIACSPTSITETLDSHNIIPLYPNPVTTRATIGVDITKEVNYQVYSKLGERLLSGTIQTSNPTIDLSQLAAGVYFLKMNQRTVKLVKVD